jgi:hypothetical protein
VAVTRWGIFFRLLDRFVISIGDVSFNNDLHFAVAAGVVVAYDWGEQDVVLKLLLFL